MITVKKKKVTDKQLEILQVIKEFWLTYKRPPDTRELTEIVGRNAGNTITLLKRYGHLKAVQANIPSDIEVSFNGNYDLHDS